MIGRFPILDVMPTVDGGRFAAHATSGAPFRVSATVFLEGNDHVGANLVIRPGGARASGDRAAPATSVRLRPGENDLFEAEFTADAIGEWTLHIEAWSDPLGTWRHAIEAKVAAGQDAAALANDLATGAGLLRRLARRPGCPQRAELRAAADTLEQSELSVADRIAPALSEPLWQRIWSDPIREQVTRSPAYGLWVDRPLAEFGSWYEFFPRSIGAEVDGTTVLRHGTFADATAELDRVAAMGFDIVYIPPIHPIGEVNRKGRNNAVTAQPGEVGSPWAIGSRHGGHDAIEPQLGTLADFDRFVARAGDLGLSVAMDLALQCAPDHPWVTAHPEWFTTLPDGTIAFAENPPKKYQDIYPLDFDSDRDGLRAEILRIVRGWIDRGVTIFRVDNPHTKPVDLWEWLIARVRETHPEVIFLAEAFTRPAMMHTLAKVGFTQSYTYFTWRTGKRELTDYALELYRSAHYMRPNFFVNTPDILPDHLVQGGPPMFAIRAILAATLSPSWGMYAGFELFENTPLRAGSEEYLDSEKYELRPRDFAAAVAADRSLEPLIGDLNRIRREHPALQHLAGLHFHGVDNDALLCFSRRAADGDDTLLIVVTLAAHGEQWGHLDLDMPALGMDWNERFRVVDLLSGDSYPMDRYGTVRLDALTRAAHIFGLVRGSDLQPGDRPA